MSSRRSARGRTAASSQPTRLGSHVTAQPPAGASVDKDDRLNHATGGAVAAAREHEAVASARQRLALQKQAVGEKHPEYATGLNQLALLLIMHGDPEAAEPLLRQALEIRKAALGEHHPDYATNLSSLAGLLWARGDLDGAEPLLRQALEIRWEVLGSGHPKSIASLNSLEQLLRAKQDWAGIERLSARDLSSGAKPAGSDPGARAATVAPPPKPAPAAAPVVEKAPVPPPAKPAAPAAPVVERAPAAPTVPATPAAKPAPAATPVVEKLPVPPPARESKPAAATAPRVEPPAAAKPAAPAPPAATPPPAAAVTPKPESRPAPRVETRPAPPASAPPRPSQAAAAAGPSRVELARQHETVSAEFARVGEQLAREAEQWKIGGAPPSQSLIDDLSRTGRDFAALRESVLGLAQALGIEVRARRLTNLQEVGELLNDLGEAEGRRDQLEALRGQAVAVLDRVLALKSADGKTLAPLDECQKRAREQREAIGRASAIDLPADATRLAEGDHAFNALLTLVEGDGLSDDVWASSLDAVELAFGKPLSVAVARSKIVAPAGT